MRHRILVTLGICLVAVAVAGNVLLWQRKRRLNYKLWEALGHRDTEQAEAVIRAGADVNCRCPQSYSYSGGSGATRTRSHPGDTPLHLAVWQASTQERCPVVELLLKRGADPNAANESGWTPLHIKGRLSFGDSHAEVEYTVVEILLRYGAEVNMADSDGATPLHYFAWHGATEVCKLLIEHGATVTLNQQILLGKADEAIRQLEADPARTNRPGIWGLRPIHAAAKRADKRLIEYLVEHGADINALSDDGSTPLLFLASKYYAGKETAVLVEYLLDNGADMSIGNAVYGTPLDQAIRHASYEEPECPLLLIARGADLSDSSQWSEGPLATAIRHDKRLVVQAILVKAKEEDLWPDLGLDNALLAASGHPSTRPETVETLLAHGANPNARPPDDGWTPLHCLAQEEHMRFGAAIAEVLIKHGANVNARDLMHRTPLHFADDNPPVKAVLLKHGATK